MPFLLDGEWSELSKITKIFIIIYFIYLQTAALYQGTKLHCKKMQQSQYESFWGCGYTLWPLEEKNFSLCLSTV